MLFRTRLSRSVAHTLCLGKIETREGDYMGGRESGMGLRWPMEFHCHGRLARSWASRENWKASGSAVRAFVVILNGRLEPACSADVSPAPRLFIFSDETSAPRSFSTYSAAYIVSSSVQTYGYIYTNSPRGILFAVDFISPANQFQTPSLLHNTSRVAIISPASWYSFYLQTNRTL